MFKSLRSVSVITGLLVCLLGGLAPSVRAVDILDDPIQIDEGLVQLVQASNSLAWEMYRYHQQQPDYQPAYRAVKELWKQAG
ncbi:MAG: hypothetical protein JSS02_10670, partial [Planctomycetes bacterium]|nr:hypothetical protein [Planctomycetota bacterium]